MNNEPFVDPEIAARFDRDGWFRLGPTFTARCCMNGDTIIVFEKDEHKMAFLLDDFESSILINRMIKKRGLLDTSLQCC